MQVSHLHDYAALQTLTFLLAYPLLLWCLFVIFVEDFVFWGLLSRQNSSDLTQNNFNICCVVPRCMSHSSGKAGCVYFNTED